LKYLILIACLISCGCAPKSRATITSTASGIEISVEGRRISVVALAGGIVRVRQGLTGELPEDASWAVPAAVRASREAVTPISNGFATAELRVTADPATGAIRVADPSGNVLLADSSAPSANGGGYVLQKTMAPGAHYFGLGDKVGPMDHAGQAFTLWNTDRPLQDGDPNYKSIPYILQVGSDGRATGLLVDDTWRSVWDFGKAVAGRLSITTDGGPIDYYVVAGPTPKAVTQRYAMLTGTMPLPPIWALGYHQSRYSYGSADEVRSLVSRFRRDNIPLDAVWEDIDFQFGKRPFTVNTVNFPDLAELIGELSAQQVKMVLITDLHVADVPGMGYAPYDLGASGDQFVKRSNGTVYTGSVWPNRASPPAMSVFPDFTQARARSYWGSLYKAFVGYGAAGFWNDMNEPSVFDVNPNTMPLTNIHRIASDDFKPRTATHAEIHNVYGMENARATYEGVRALRPTERPFVLTRATYAGGQRYAATWTGDNTSNYDQLALSVSMILNLGLSGYALTGADVGGYLGGPTADLLTRWTEAAAFQPFMRTHSTAGTRYSEPWTDGPIHEAIRRRFIQERYRLMPTFYALAEEASRTGLPINRPVWMAYPDALNTPCAYKSSFLLGDTILVAPALGDAPAYDVCLPSGAWYDYWSGAPRSDTVHVTPSIGEMPVYVRAGTILVKQQPAVSTSSTPGRRLEIDIYPGGDCHGSLYFDDGHSTAFRSGAYLRQQLTCSVLKGGVAIAFGTRAGRYKPWWSGVDLVVHNWIGAAAAFIGKSAAATTLDRQRHTVTISIADPGSSSALTVKQVTG
jgi:alpha-glucosidase